MVNPEHAVRRYIDAWFEPEPARRAQLLEQCFAADGKIRVADQVIDGRDALAAAIAAFRADPERPNARLISRIDADGLTFRFRVALTGAERARELIDLGELDDDGRISTLYTFREPLPDAPIAAQIDAPSARAAQRYVDLFGERDPAARRARLEACFAPTARFVTRRRSFHGWAAIAAMIDAALADPRGLVAARTSEIDVAGRAFRFATIGTFADGSAPFSGPELNRSIPVRREARIGISLQRGAPLGGEDAGEIGDDGRITAIYAFADRLPAA